MSEPESSPRPYAFARTICGCRLCSISCEHLPGALSPDDVARIAAFLSYNDLRKFAQECLLASEGGIAADSTGRVVRLPTLVPATNADGSCRFYRDGRCEIHAVSPFGCAFIDAHLSETEFNERVRALNSELLCDHDLRGPYHQLVDLLNKSGRTAPPLATRQYRLSKAIRKERLDRPR